METQVKEIIKQSIVASLAQSGQPLDVIDMASNRILTAVMALAYNNADAKLAAADIYDIPTQSFGDDIEAIETLFQEINGKFSKQVEAFMTFLEDKENEEIIEKVQKILA